MNTRRRTFKVHGMDCAEEVATLKREVGPVVGGEEHLAFDLLNAKMIVSEGASASSEAILKAVASTGMNAEPWRESAGSGHEKSGRQKVQLVLTIFSGGLTALAFGLHIWSSGGFHEALGAEGMGHVHRIPWASKGAYLGAMFAACWFIAPKAWLSARRLRPDMNLLMVIAILGAISIGEWFEAATVAFLFAVSNALEGWSLSRARRAVEALMDLTPTLVQLVKNGGSTPVRPEEVSVGALFHVRPGERVPLDGLVLQGTSALNQAPITGESMPVTKVPGEEVFAGSINGDGALVIECSRPASDTVLARIIRMIGEASTKRAASEQWVDRFAKVYTPVVMVLALLVALVPPLMLGGIWGDWFYRALVLLVIACPCALVISTPVSIVAGLASAARHGALVKGGMYLEIPAHLKAIAFDKTGTLTEGHPSVVQVVPLNGHTKLELLRVAGAMESQSDHPLARAIVAHVKSQGVAFMPAQDFQAFQGKGATAFLNGSAHWLGSHRFLEEQGAESPDVHAQLESLDADGRTVVAFGVGRELIGFLALADAVRPTTASVFQNLRGAGVEHLVLLTGDNKGTAQAVGRQVGLTEIQAELMPEDKVKAIEALVAKYGQVAMIGDGVNDAPAMARATLGIAMGAMGSDAAVETADIALMNDDLTRIPWLVNHSHRTLTVIRQNITFALAVKALFVVLTMVGHASLWSAIAADMGASLLVIFNGLRLLKA
ncbi:heavy metal translocating P-type ATPase [Geothrix sp.]|jgi:Cd2+/Zn2+-exporting ATPase|uniref:heavy metal translocating P-type ATPase n=1 Tax=Geothrix sp. TaxID=1962974 RepID=UPI0025BE8DE8|nr:heavy metal translocating P-type ATPase [Geothrix sp.]